MLQGMARADARADATPPGAGSFGRQHFDFARVVGFMQKESRVRRAAVAPGTPK